jgi:flagellar M-ring protein FliF
MDSSPNPMVPAQAADTSLVGRSISVVSRLTGMADQPALRRALPAVAMVMIAAASLALYLLLTPSDRVALQHGLPEAEKSRALDALIANGFDAKLDPTTGTLTVGPDEFYRARMVLASEGLPQGQPDGLSTITDMPMGTSRSVEAARLRRMQELDLARSITELRPVRSARVHLALPERSAFVRDQQPPQASVVLNLVPGMSISEAQVRAIVSLVSAAIPQMPRENVSVVDQTGRLLSKDPEDPFNALTDRHMRHQLEMETLYRERILALITPIVGPGNAAVEVTLDIDFTRSEVTSEEYAPELTAVRSEQMSSQTSSSREAGGIPGTVANTPPPEPVLGDEVDQESQTVANGNMSKSETRNYEVSRRVETIQPESAVIRRVNAAVLLRTPTPEDPEAPATFPAETLAEIERLTKGAVGFEDGRNDVVIVSSSPFVDVEMVEATPVWHEASWLPTAGRILAQIVIFGIITLGVLRPLLNRLLPPVQDNSTTAMNISESVEVGPGETLSTLRAKLDEVAPDAEDLNGALSYEEKIKLLKSLAESESPRIATAFQNMIASDQEVTT